MFEYFNWIDLPVGAMEAALELGYDENSWVEIKTNPIEFIKFKDLIEGLTEKATVVGNFTLLTDDVQGALMDLDLFTDGGLCWDFYVNHYDGYTWSELAETVTPFGGNVQEIVATLGWDEMMWDNTDFTGDIPEAECKFWITLDPVEKWAYRSLGWDFISFDLAPCDPRCKKSLACPFNAE